MKRVTVSTDAFLIICDIRSVVQLSGDEVDDLIKKDSV